MSNAYLVLYIGNRRAIHEVQGRHIIWRDVDVVHDTEVCYVEGTNYDAISPSAC